MANKGEWSESYAAIRILADGRLYLAGDDGHRDLTEWMDVLSLYRLESIKMGRAVYARLKRKSWTN